MAQVWDLPAETEAQPEDTPAVVATGTGTSAFDVLPSAMPSWPLPPPPAHHCVCLQHTGMRRGSHLILPIAYYGIPHPLSPLFPPQ